MVFEPSFVICPWCFLSVPPHLVPGQVFFERTEITHCQMREIHGRKSWQLVPDCEQLCFAVRRNSSTALGDGWQWEKVSRVLRVGRQQPRRGRGGDVWELELHSVSGHGGGMERFWLCTDE